MTSDTTKEPFFQNKKEKYISWSAVASRFEDVHKRLALQSAARASDAVDSHESPLADSELSSVKRPARLPRIDSYDSPPKGWTQHMNSEARFHLHEDGLSLEEVYTRMMDVEPKISAMNKSEVLGHLQNIKTQFGL